MWKKLYSPFQCIWQWWVGRTRPDSADSYDIDGCMKEGCFHQPDESDNDGVVEQGYTSHSYQLDDEWRKQGCIHHSHDYANKRWMNERSRCMFNFEHYCSTCWQRSNLLVTTGIVVMTGHYCWPPGVMVVSPGVLSRGCPRIVINWSMTRLADIHMAFSRGGGRPLNPISTPTPVDLPLFRFYHS